MTNDGATILGQMEVEHQIAKLLVEVGPAEGTKQRCFVFLLKRSLTFLTGVKVAGRRDWGRDDWCCW